MSNVIALVGTCGRDAEVKHTPSGQAVLNVTIANNIGYGDKQQTLWFRVVLWGKRAEGQLKDYLKKGQQVFVSGELSQSQYTGNDGTIKTLLEINANIVDLVGKKSDQAPPAATENYKSDAIKHQEFRQAKAELDKKAQAFTEYDDDIPF